MIEPVPEWIATKAERVARTLRDLGIDVGPGLLVDTTTAAIVLQKSPRTLESWRANGIGPCYGITSGKCIYDLEQLLAWAFRNLRESTMDRATAPGQHDRRHNGDQHG